MTRFKDKLVLITGAGRGIGKECALQFLAEGAKVIGLALHPLNYSHQNLFGYCLDVSNRIQIQSLLPEIIAKHGIPEILVNNAGITKDGLTQKMPDEDWDKVISVNLTGIYNLTKPLIPEFLKTGKAQIINITSIVGQYGNIGQANYAAAKAGVIGLTKTWAKEFARKGANIRVNAVAPGFILTDMMKTVPDTLLEKFKGQTMLNRLGEPKEVANVVLFLASDDSSYITGATIDVNGGMRL